MRRRQFLSTLLGLAATAQLDPERLLWRPRKTIFIPPWTSTSAIDDFGGEFFRESPLQQKLRDQMFVLQLARNGFLDRGYVRLPIAEQWFGIEIES